MASIRPHGSVSTFWTFKYIKLITFSNKGSWILFNRSSRSQFLGRKRALFGEKEWFSSLVCVLGLTRPTEKLNLCRVFPLRPFQGLESLRFGCSSAACCRLAAAWLHSDSLRLADRSQTHGIVLNVGYPRIWYVLQIDKFKKINEHRFFYLGRNLPGLFLLVFQFLISLISGVSPWSQG